MLARNAAALLGGAAAAHGANLLFHTGVACGVSGFGEGRALIVLAALVPGMLLLWAFWGRSGGCVSFLLGACAGYATDEWVLLPAFGWTVTTAIWAGSAAIAHGRRREPVPVSGGAWGSVWCGVALGLAAGFSYAVLRPFLMQHVAGTRSGVRIAVVVGLAAVVAGAVLGSALKRALPRWGAAACAAVLWALGATTTLLLLPRAVGGVRLPLLRGAWADTWWGQSLLAAWGMTGLMAMAWGVAAPLVDRRRAVACLLAALCAGTWAGERLLASWARDPAAVRALADRVARHGPLQRVSVAALDPDGLWTRFRARTLIEVEDIGFWQGSWMERGDLWHNLEAAEVEPVSGVAPLVLGPRSGGPTLFADGLNPLRAVDRAAPHVTQPSFGFLASGLALRETVELVRARASSANGSFRTWCDPRALTPAGLRSLLATWREALPEATFLVLVDGYNGPLLGLRVAPGSRFPIADALAIFEAPVATAFRGPLGPPSTRDRPVLEWLAAPRPSPFLHPEPDVMEVLVDALAVPEGTALAELLNSLVIHARAQAIRQYVISRWDHVAIPDAEVEAVMTGLRKDEQSPAIIRHLRIVFDVLYRKREFALLVRHAEEAVARRPDVFEFHRTLGKAYHDLLDFEGAVEELAAARALAPDHHEIAMELSRALGAARRWPEAVAILEAEQARSDDPAVMKGLAIARLEAGDPAAAEAVRAAAARFPDDLDLQRALERVTR